MTDIVAYLDCFSGVSGDMFLGALLDAGLPVEDLEERLKSLALGNFGLEITREERSHIFGTRLQVKVDKNREVHRGLSTIREMIQEGNLSQGVKERSIRIFEALAEAEGTLHNLPPEAVHFHEVGAVDSIVDVVGVVYGLERLGVGAVFVSPLPLGSGFAESAHGRIPVPAPATMSLLKGIPVYDSGLPHEMVTPTGAALVKNVGRAFGPMPSMRPKQVGYGVGKRDLPDRPNLLRIVIGEQEGGREGGMVVVLEANIDDASPEWLGFLMDRLFGAGALDVVFCPVQMKKNRPGVQVQVMGRPDQRDRLADIIFSESTTLGIRFRYSERRVLSREAVEVESPWGPIKVQKIIGPEGLPLFQPEYEACREIALKENRSLKEIFYWIMGLNRERRARKRGS